MQTEAKNYSKKPKILKIKQIDEKEVLKEKIILPDECIFSNFDTSITDIKKTEINELPTLDILVGRITFYEKLPRHLS